MALPENPVSGDYRCTNPGRDDCWTCPNCYADHLSGHQILVCKCGATLKLTIEQEPVCVAECVDPDFYSPGDEIDD